MLENLIFLTLICSIASRFAVPGSGAFLPLDPESGCCRYRYVKRSRARIRAGKNRIRGPGINIPDPQHWLHVLHWFIFLVSSKGVKIFSFLGQYRNSVLGIRVCIKLNVGSGVASASKWQARSGSVPKWYAGSRSASICRWHAKMYRIWAYLSTFSRFRAFIWKCRTRGKVSFSCPGTSGAP